MQMLGSELRDGMRIDWDVPITMDDGLVLRADVYRPPGPGRFPVIVTYGPYGKWVHFDDLYKDQWRIMCAEHPDVPAGSSNKYQNWEVVDPEKWVPDGYAIVRIDSRGAGRSPGVIDIWSAREADDFALCIDWAGTQPWSSGKVGLNGISYYAMNQWQVATRHPKHLTAMCIWEGAADFYRDMGRHGGILCNGFAGDWPVGQIWPVQHGRGKRGLRSRMNGELASGPETLTEEQLGANRHDFLTDVRGNRLASDPYWTSRMPDWSKVAVPFLSAANWGGQGLHPRGNFEGFLRAATEQKWLEVHGIEHWTHFYTDYGLAIQKRFFGHFLKDVDTGWSEQPRVVLQVRHPGEVFVERAEAEWPLARTQWTRYYLDLAAMSLGTTPQHAAATTTYQGFGPGVTLLTQPLAAPIEITGPIAARLYVSATTEDADLFLILRVFAPDMKEVVFQGALDPHTPVAQGWLRVSHRKLDPALSRPWRPYHTHDEARNLTPGEVVEVEVEVWPTSIVVPAGHRIGLSIRGTDYEYPGGAFGGLETLGKAWSGVGPFRHTDPIDRPAAVFGADVTLHAGPDRQACLLLPIIPEA
jgi:predicted acyl esterase